MGKVLIIKNNNEDVRIHQYAEKSYQENKKYYYNPAYSTLNEEGLKELGDKFEGNGIVLLITYENSELKEIEDIFIGADVNINEQKSVEYVMKLHLTGERHKRTIESIIDKIDLDLSEDFVYGRYIMMSDMESLYQELRERIEAKAKGKVKCLFDEDNEKQPKKSYELNELAQKDSQSVRIYPSDDVDEYRTEFQRDRERVVNCKAFRRLVDKAQIFGSEKGDYYRTRMTHSLEVNQIAKAISYALGLNLDLTEAIALGHDLGHTPFGHQGERTLDEILHGKIDVGIVATDEMFKEKCFGGFKHNYQSARILTEIEEKYKEFPGLNVSVQVVEGVLKHTKLKPDEINIRDFLSKEYLDKIKIDEKVQVCSSLEGQVVAVADEIAQRGHDVDDALTSGVMTMDDLLDRFTISKCVALRKRIENEIEEIENFTRSIIDKKELKIARIVSIIINYFIANTIEYSIKQMQDNQSVGKITLNNSIKIIGFSPDVKKVNDYLEKVVQKKVICNNEVARADYNASMIVQALFKKYYKNPRLLHYGTVHKIFLETLKHENSEVSNSAINLNDGSIDLVNKEIADMTVKELDSEIMSNYLKDKDSVCTDENVVLFEKRRILIRAIVDYIAGMTDGYALEEYEKLK